MNRDNAIKYNAKLVEVKDNIEEIKKLNISANTFGAMLKDIEKNVKTKVEDCYKRFESEDSNTFLYSSLDIIYTEAIKELEKINSYLSREYTSYFKIQATVNELETRLKDFKYNEVDELVSEAIKLTREIKETDTINYDDEKNVVEAVYKVVYEILKLESIYGTNSDLLDTIYEDEVDSVYISRLIKEDVKKLKNDKDIEKLVKEINKTGFEGRNYIDKDLIRLITYISKPEYSDRIKDSLIEKIRDYKEVEETQEINEDEVRRTEYRIQSINRDKERIDRISRGNLLKLLLIGTIIGATSFGSSKLFKAIFSNVKEYKTTTEEYDSLTGEVETTEEYSMENPGVELTVYTPWEYNKTHDVYKRMADIYKINDPNLELEDFEDYTKIDASELSKIKFERESTDILLDDMNYEGNRYVITRITRDENDFQIPNTLILRVVLSTIITATATAGAIIFLSDDYWTPETIMSKTKDLKKELKEAKRELLEMKEKLLTPEELMEIRGKVLDQYEKLPTALRSDRNIERKMEEIKVYRKERISVVNEDEDDE